MPQANHYTTSKENFIKSVKADPAGAINSGMLEQKKQEVPFGGAAKAVAKGVAKVAEKVIAKKTAEKTAEKAAEKGASTLKAQQTATVANKAKLDRLQGSIKDLEAQIKANSQKAAEYAKKPKAPGAPSDRESGLLDANKKLAEQLKNARQAYYDAKSSW
jgi:hypothetical protein